MADPLPAPKKIFDLEGEAQVNADGRSRQEELRRCVPGEPVELRRERGNQADSDVITILSARGVPIGRLTRQYAALLGPPLDEEQERYRQRREQAGAAPASARATPPAWAGATIFRGGDPDATQLALVCAILALGVLAVYKLANAIASACWACG